MSFILKALKKLEQEKAQRQPAPVDLETAILSGGRSMGSTSRLFKWNLIVVTFVAGGVLTYVFTHTGTEKSADVAWNQAEVANIPTVAQAPVTATVPPPVATVEPAPNVPQEDKVLDGSARVRPPLQRASEAATPSRRRVAADLPPISPAPQEADAPPPAGIKVNGIALHDDPWESVAVINGALVKKGMVVEGAKVEEIYADRVKFAGRSGTFQVQLSK